MNTEEQMILRNVADILFDTGSISKKFWRRTSVLARKLKLEEERLLEVLIQYVRHTSPKEQVVRYNQFPSLNGLEILWGHTQNVGHMRLPSIYQERGSEVPGECCEPGRQVIFFSYSYRELRKALAVRERLLEKFNVWVDALHLSNGEVVINGIRDAIEQSDQFVLYITKASLGSTWAWKELMTASQIKQPAYILDGELNAFLPQLQAWLRDGNEGARDYIVESVVTPDANVSRQQRQRQLCCDFLSFLAEDFRDFKSHAERSSNGRCFFQLHPFADILEDSNTGLLGSLDDWIRVTR
jgi:hypothetical protein